MNYKFEKKNLEVRNGMRLLRFLKIESTPQKTPPKSKILVVLCSIRIGDMIFNSIPESTGSGNIFVQSDFAVFQSQHHSISHLLPHHCAQTCCLKNGWGMVTWWGQFATQFRPKHRHPQKNRDKWWFVVST